MNTSAKYSPLLQSNVVAHPDCNAVAPFEWWLRATRPKTLLLSFMPTATGIAWAWHDGNVVMHTAAGTLLCAVLLQVLTNFVNDMGDYERGADTPERLGPPRTVALGVISPRSMRRAAIGLSAIILAIGLYLVAHVGWWLLGVGLLALVCAWLYTTGPRPIAYIGLGDFAAIIFFGIIPSIGAYAIQLSHLSMEALVSGISYGSFAAAVLSINNLRDYLRDRAVGKKTLVVRVGRERAIRYIQTLLIVPYLMALVQSITLPHLSVSLVSLPIAWSIARNLSISHGQQFNLLLSRTILATTLYGTLSISAIIGVAF